MADEQPKAPEAKAAKPSFAGVLLTAALAGGAAFGGARFGAPHAAPAHAAAPVVTMPGPTVPLDAFLVTVSDHQRAPHVIKLTLAVELKVTGKEDDFKAFVPRIRDATLTYLRSLTYEEAQGGGQQLDRLRTDLLERIEKLGVATAERVLVTDFVTQ